MVTKNKRQPTVSRKCKHTWTKITALASLPFLFAFAHTFNAQAAGVNGKIIFSNSQTGNSELFTINPDGSGVTQITNDPSAHKFSASWSPDGKTIVFCQTPSNPSSEDESDAEIYTMSTDGSNAKRLTNNVARDENPSFSPDGKYIVFQSTLANPAEMTTRRDLFIMDATVGDSTVKQITPSKSTTKRITFSSVDPSWSAANNKIVFTQYESDGSGTYKAGIFLMTPEGTEKDKLSDTTSTRDVTPAWSSDGSKIVFSRIWADSITGAETSDLFRLDVKPKDPLLNLVPTTTTQLTSNNNLRYANPSYSPDGQVIVALQNQGNDLVVMNQDGTNQRVILSSESGKSLGSASWQNTVDCNGSNCSKNPRLLIDNEQGIMNTFKNPVPLDKTGFQVSGKLLNSGGEAIGGAKIDILQQVALRGSPLEKIGEVQTDMNGNWKTVVPKGPIRTVKFAYRTFQSDTDYSATSNAFSQKVNGKITFRAPKRVKRGKKTTLNGSVAGGYIAKNGKVVELQIYFKKKWRPLKLLRTNSQGTFKLRIAFGKSYRTGSYKFRFSVRPDGGWPFLKSVSKTAKIKVT